MKTVKEFLTEGINPQVLQMGAKEIIRQIPTHVKMSIGYHNPVVDSSKNKVNVTFKCGGRQIWFTIELDPSDTYSVTRIKGTKKKTLSGIYNDQLGEIIQNLYQELF